MNLDRIFIAQPKRKKDISNSHAESRGESVNGFINRAIEKQIERDKGGKE